MSGPLVCIGCEVGGDANLLATVLSVVGALTGIAGAITGVQAFIASQANHDAAIFRDEFERHRLPIESALQIIKRHLVIMRRSASPIMPLETLIANFAKVRHEAEQAVGAILSEAEDIDLRELTRFSWVGGLARFQATLEVAWEALADESSPQPVRLQAALTIIANLEGISSATRTRIEDCVKAPLTKRRWLQKA